MNLGIVTNYTRKAAFGLANWLNPLFSTKIVIFLSVFTEIFEKFEIIVGILIAEVSHETTTVSSKLPHMILKDLFVSIGCSQLEIVSAFSYLV